MQILPNNVSHVSRVRIPDDKVSFYLKYAHQTPYNSQANARYGASAVIFFRRPNL